MGDRAQSNDLQIARGGAIPRGAISIKRKLAVVSEREGPLTRGSRSVGRSISQYVIHRTQSRHERTSGLFEEPAKLTEKWSGAKIP